MVSPLQTNNNNNNNNNKRKFGNKKEFFKKKIKNQRTEGGIAFKKPKAPKIPVYNETVQPAQLLNEVGRLSTNHLTNVVHLYLFQILLRIRLSA